jgi:hypothetical protein
MNTTTITQTQELFQAVSNALGALMPGSKEQSDNLLKNVEDITLLIFQIYQLKSTKDRIIAVLAFLKFRSAKPLSTIVVGRVKEMITSFEVEFNRKMDLKLSEPHFQSGAPVPPPVRDLLDDWDRMDDSPLAAKIRSLVGYCMAFSLLEQCGLTENFAEIIYAEFNIERKKTKKVTGFIYAILDVVEFVFSKAKTCYEEGSLRPMFHTATTYTTWFDKFTELKRWSLMLDYPEVNGFTEHQYIHDLEEAIEKGENMQKLAKSIQDRKFIAEAVSQLKLLRSDHLTIKRASKMRRTPFAFELFGETSIGKTYVTMMMFHFFGKFKNFPTGEEYIYIRNPNDDFMSGYNSQVIYVMVDDVGYMNPDIASQGDPSLLELIQMINAAPYVTNQAALEKKGKVPFIPEIVGASTNTRTMNVDKYFSHPSAVQRRLPYIIEPVVKAKYRKKYLNDSGESCGYSPMLDSSLVPPPVEGQYADLWDFTVHEILPQQVKRHEKERILLAEEKLILKNANQEEFFKWYASAITKHYSNQNKMLESTNAFQTVEVCEHGLPSYMCSEPHLQEGEDLCDHCHHNCIWKNYHEACGSICSTCNHCMSEEDMMEGSCTTCLVNLQLQIGLPQPIITYSRNLFTELVILMWCGLQMFFGLFSNGLRADHIGVARYNYQQVQLARRVVVGTETGVRQMRQIFANMGERAEQILGERPFTKVLIVMTAIIAALKLVLKATYKMEGGVVSRIVDEDGATPEKTDREGFNPWKNENYVLSPLDTHRLTKSYKALPKDQFVKICSKNQVAIRIKSNGTYRNNNMFCICDRYYLVNSHSMPTTDEFYIDMIFQEDLPGITSNLKNVAIGQSQVTRLKGDMAIVFIPQVAPRRDLRDLFASENFGAKCNGYYIYRNDQGLIEFDREIYNINKKVLHNVQVEGDVSAFTGSVVNPTEKGFCGSMMIVESFHGPILAGMHYLGSSKDNMVVSFAIDREVIDDFFINKYIVDVGDVTLSCSMNSYELETLNKKSPLLYVEEGVAQCAGSLKGFRSHPKSLVSPTLVSEFWKNERNIPHTHDKPLLKGYLPWRNALLPMVQDNFTLSWARVEIVSEAYVNDIFRNLPHYEGELLEIYDLETSLNGGDGIQYVDKINFNTSAGFPFNKSKKFVIEPRLGEDGRITGKVDIDDEVFEQYKAILAGYDKGERCNPIFSASLKDEARKLDKILKGETRVFSGCPFAFTLVTRKYCLSFIRVVQRNRLAFECAVGTNTHSQDWQSIVDFLKWFGDDLFDGDYKNYDKSMMAMLIYAAALIPMRLMQRYKVLTPRQQLHYHCLAADLAYSWVNFNGDLITFLRNNPSGHALTVIINCIVNSFYFRLSYSALSPADKTCEKFQDHVKLVTYGDDFVAGVNSTLAPWFNFSAVKSEMEKIGVVLTRADKKDGEFLFKTLRESDFLKRRFVFDDRLQRYIAPLDIASIEKSLVIGLKSKTISQQLQSVAIMSSALREMFFHGEENYVTFRNQIMKCVTEYDLAFYVGPNDFPLHCELLEYYQNPDSDCSYKPERNDDFDMSSFELQSGTIQISDVKPIRLGGHVDISSDAYTLDLIEHYYLGKITERHEHPTVVRKIAFGHYQGEGARSGQICMVEYINQNVYVESSYCSGHNPIFCDNFREHGLSIHFRMCEPQSFFLEAGSTEAQFEESIWTLNNWPAFSIRQPINNRTNSNYSPSGVSNGTGALSPVERGVDSPQIQEIVPLSLRSTQTRFDYLRQYLAAENPEDTLSDSETSGLLSLEFQSGAETIDESSTTAAEGNQVILEYVDENPGSTYDFNPIRDNTFYEGYAAEASIAKFMERPVLISSQTWDENTDINYTVLPWSAYFGDDVIKRKITNYSLLSCNLHVKVMINASPFYYGLAYMNYTPLPSFIDPNSIREGTGSRNAQVPFSQRPHICLYPQSSQGGEMHLPFMYYKNWLRINSAGDFDEMGALNVRSFTLLQNANSVSSGGATIQIYAWATDVCVAGPTLNLALQAGDEYEVADGAISGPASAIARAGRELGRVPIIGPYAMATGFIASKIASVAKYFGFTNVPNNKDVDPFKNVPFHGFASTEISTPIEKLSFDAKNELSIDPRIVGLPPKDELLISEFVGHESWIYTSTWEAGDNVDTILFTSRVMPELIRQFSETYRYATPMALLNRYFQYWRGDIIFRFRIISTKFHRGRLRITYDPDGNTVATSKTSTTSFTKIVDISEESDFQIRIPYMQALGYLKTAIATNSFQEHMTSGDNAVARDPESDNGQISVRVFTKQTSPVASAPIQLVVSCWGAENLEFAAPSEGPQDYSSFNIQSGELQYDTPTEMIIQADRKDENINLVFHGEHIVSLRQLMRRTNFYVSVPFAVPGTSAQSICYNTFRFPRMPLDYGYDPNGSFIIPGIVAPTPFKANIVKQSLLTNIMKCFVAHRGSMVYHMNVDSPHELSTIEVTRAVGPFTNVRPDLQAVSAGQAASVRSSYARILKNSGFQGRTLTNQHTQTGISVHLPMYSNRRFLATNPGNTSSPSKVDGSDQDTFDVQVITKPIVNPTGEGSSDLNLYYMIGTDFSLHCFLNVPTQVRYNLPVA